MKTYKIDKRKIIEFLDDGADYAIELYKDGSYSVLPIDAAGYPNDRINRLDVEYCDFKECDKKLEIYFRAIEVCFFSVADEVGYMVNIV